jgi:ribosomal protein S24E
MKLTLTQEKKQPLLGRKEYLYFAEYPQAATPSLAEVTQAVVAATKSPEHLIVIKKLHTRFGVSSAQVDAIVYDNEQSFSTYQVIHKKQKKPAEGKSQPAAPEAKK